MNGHALYLRKGLVANLSYVFTFNIGCSSLKGRLQSVPDYKCRKSTGEIRPFEGVPAESVVISDESLK